MSCHKKLQTETEVANPQTQELKEISPPKDSSTKMMESPNPALSKKEPQHEKMALPPAGAKKPTESVTPTQTALQKNEEPQQTTPNPQTEKRVAVAPQTTTTKPAEEKTPVEKPVIVKKEELKKDDPKTASHFIIAAYKTMINEGQKIGAACNFYLERVLEVMGFKTVDFLANDFDVAAKKMFKSFKVFTFTNQTELKRHIWSYRERTGFIFQWERVGAPGHVAIVERVGETLYIYQASLNKYTARVEKTNLERLLQVNHKQGVRVYSDLQK